MSHPSNKRPGLPALPEQLLALQRSNHLQYLGTDRPDGRLAVEVHEQVRELAARPMVDWVHGFTAGLLGSRQPEDQRDRESIATVRPVLVNPGPHDQVRMRVRLGIEQDGLTVHEFADRNGVTVKSIAEALRFGPNGTIGMLAVLGRDPDFRQDLAERDPDLPVDADPPEGWTEPDVIARLRALAYCHEQGVIRWLGPTEVNKAYYTRTFSVRVGADDLMVHTNSVRHWLLGAADAILPAAGDDMYAAIVAARTD